MLNIHQYGKNMLAKLLRTIRESRGQI